MYKLLSCFVVLSVSLANAGDFPVERCRRGDDACLAKVTQEVFKNNYGGIREMNLLPFDPLRVNSLVLERNPSSPVNLELKFKDLDIIGIKSANVKSFKGLDFNERSVFEALMPELTLKGIYSVDGRVLILPIVGNGDAVITCKNLHFKYSFDLKQVEKNGKIYAELEHVKLEIKPELVHFQLDNLFNGDKALGDNMNKFINENWHEIFTELEPALSKALGLVGKQMMNNVFSKFPYEELVL